MATILKNANIFTASDSYRADIVVEGEKIARIAEKCEPATGDTVIDLAGLEVYPGAIDVHTHLDMPFMGTSTADDFESGTIAAACGGTTSIVDFAIPSRGQGLVDAIGVWRKKAEGKSAIDYGFHATVIEFNEKIAADIPKVVEEGVTSFKCFLAYKGALMIDDGQFIEALTMARKCGALVSIHAENGEMLAYLCKKLPTEGKTAPMYHEVAHPVIAEREATHRGIEIAKMTGTPLYVVHMSCSDSLEEVKAARNAGQFVFGETCTQYLVASNELYHLPGFEGAKWVMSPPLRDKSNNEKMWRGLREGFLQVVATDHCSFTMKQKEAGLNDFTKIPNGAPGIGDRVNIVYSAGVKKGKITRNQFAAVTSTNPAKIFGMFPKKGAIAVGSDADLTIIDPNKKGKITIGASHYKTDYSSYEGFELEGMCVKTMLRGRIIAENNEFKGSKEFGEFLKRNKFEPSDWAFHLEPADK